MPENASTNEVEKAYKSLAIYYHPDKHVERKEWAEEKMKQLNEAKELLSNPAKRTAYIQQIKAYQNSQINQTRTLQRENIVLKRKLESSNQTNAVLGFALLLIGGAMLLGD